MFPLVMGASSIPKWRSSSRECILRLVIFFDFLVSLDLIFVLFILILRLTILSVFCCILYLKLSGKNVEGVRHTTIWDDSRLPSQKNPKVVVQAHDDMRWLQVTVSKNPRGLVQAHNDTGWPGVTVSKKSQGSYSSPRRYRMTWSYRLKIFWERLIRHTALQCAFWSPSQKNLRVVVQVHDDMRWLQVTVSKKSQGSCSSPRRYNLTPGHRLKKIPG
jgi:hypothetical protein